MDAGDSGCASESRFDDATFVAAGIAATLDEVTGDGASGGGDGVGVALGAVSAVREVSSVDGATGDAATVDG
ncbi:MAG: hypothetical protein AB7P00_18300, partial [Sandaracinaceae bacterium]